MSWSGEYFKCRKCGEVYPYRLSTCSCGGVCDKISEAPQGSSSGLNPHSSILADILEAEKQKEQAKYENTLTQLYSAVKDACSKNEYAAAISYLEKILGITPDSMDAKNLLDFCKDKVEQQRREETKMHDLSIPGDKAGERKILTVNGVEFAFRWCPAGIFMMGAPENEEGRYDDDENQHQVTLTKGFWMMETQVTLGMFKAFVGDTGYESKGLMPYGWTGSSWEQNSKYSWRNPGFSQDDKHPVTCISWNDAVEFCKWLSKKTEQNITLPTEAQWEYACRAGSTTAYFWGSALNGDKANCNGNFPCGTTIKGKYIGKTTPVGSYEANAWGLYDTHGNVWEWCQDWRADYPSGSVTDPVGPSTGSNRVLRGGGWYSYARVCRSADRHSGYDPMYRCSYLGLRVLRCQ